MTRDPRSVGSAVLVLTVTLAGAAPVAFAAGGGGGGGGPCVSTSVCHPASPLVTCSTSGPGLDNCGRSCTAAPTCWQPYGYANPGDPTYGYGLPDNATKTLLALTAKGNVILGDYTSPEFTSLVLPKLGTGLASITQPYAIDPTDEALGYQDDGYTPSNLPRFSGNYDQQDKKDGVPAFKPDGTRRKFYQSSLPDAQFRALLDDNWRPATNPANGKIDAVIFTNHLLAGYVSQRSFSQFGSMVGRDDAMMFKRNFTTKHDARLTGAGATGGASGSSLVGVGLPLSVGRPVLRSWQECPPDPSADCL